ADFEEGARFEDIPVSSPRTAAAPLGAKTSQPYNDQHPDQYYRGHVKSDSSPGVSPGAAADDGGEE
ncbi:unnamed protein product, partial [Amoebophrya sp. A120]